MTTAVPPCFTRASRRRAFESTAILRRCHGRARRDLCRIGSRPRDSGAMFSEPFRASFHPPEALCAGLARLLFPSSSLYHALFSYLHSSLHVIAFSVNRKKRQRKPGCRIRIWHKRTSVADSGGTYSNFQGKIPKKFPFFY